MDYEKELGENMMEKIAWDMVRAVVTRLDFKAIYQDIKDRNPGISEEMWKEILGDVDDVPDLSNDELFNAFMIEHDIDLRRVLDPQDAMRFCNKEE